ncbi:MAG: ABC transporter permease subunit [Planctomycetaceae bacterium]
MRTEPHRKSLAARLSMPLLVSELSRQATRKRTYAFRVMLIVTTLIAAFSALKDVVTVGPPDVVLALGQGKKLFDLLVAIQYVVTYVFLPAYCSGLITSEKERDTLQLLLITKLSPGSILFEKLLSRLIPFAGLLAVAAPVLAVAYSYGGITHSMIWCTAYLGLLAAAQVSAIAMLCSVWFRRTVTAFVATYLLGSALLWFGPLMVVGKRSGWMWLHCPFYHQLSIMENHGPEAAFVGSWPIWLTTMGMMLIARLILVRRAFVKPSNLLKQTFQQVDKSVEAVTGTQLRDDSTIPVVEPIAWRETTRGLLGNTRYQLYSLAVVSALVLLAFVMTSGEQCRDMLVQMQTFGFAIGVLLIAAKGSSLFSQERASQTLDVLLAIPISNRVLMLQKFRGLRNLIAVLTVVYLLLAGLYACAMSTQLHWEADSQMMNVPFFGLSHLSTLVIYPQVIAWLSICVGMRIRRVLVALLVVLLLLATWCVLPLAVHQWLASPWGRQASMWTVWNAQSPLLIPMTYFRQDYKIWDAPWMLLGFNILYFGTWWYVFRRLALAQLTKHLGRTDGGAESKPVHSSGRSVTQPDVDGVLAVPVEPFASPDVGV